MEPLIEFLKLAFTALVYPGLTFLTILGLVSQWYRRKLIARLQNRVGPKYVGPAGILQPFADIYKLLFVKELVTGAYTPARLILYLVILGIVALSASTALLPLTPLHIRAEYDVLVFIYLTLYASIAMSLIGLGSVSPYPGFGGVRYATMLLVFEPVIAISLISMVKVLAPNTLSLADALSNPGILRAQQPLQWVFQVATIILAAISFSIALLSKTMLKPFDIPEAETEIAGGYLAELSGPALGLSILLHEVEISLYVFVFANLLIPIPPILPAPLSIAMSLIKYFIVLTLLVLVAYSMGRLKLDQALRALIKVPLLLSIVSLALSFTI